MLSFEITAIDLILVIAVIVLLILYMTKLAPNAPKTPTFSHKTLKAPKQEKHITIHQNDYTECPRGFGNIRKIDDKNSVSEKCLGCYRIMECYSEQEQFC
jgi:hypothetical protein